MMPIDLDAELVNHPGLKEVVENYKAQVSRHNKLRKWGCQCTRAKGFGNSVAEAVEAWWTVRNRGYVGKWNDGR